MPDEIKTIKKDFKVNVTRLKNQIANLQAELESDLTKKKPDKETLAFWNSHHQVVDKKRIKKILKKKKKLLSEVE